MKRFLLYIGFLLFPMLCHAQFFMDQRIPSPEIQGRDVTFRIKAEKADSVILVGDFLPGKNEFGVNGRLPMRKGKDGVWELQVKDLQPEFYYYHFLVDGVWTLDYSNLHLVRNFVEYENSLIVPGEESRDYELCETKKGSLVSLWYDSPEYGTQRHMNVYLPHGYSASKKYPVLYLQHGGGDDEATWVEMGRICQILDHQIADGRTEPMIVVIPNTMPDEAASQDIMPVLGNKKGVFALRGTAAFHSGGDYANDLLHNIIPYVKQHFSVRKGRKNRALAGLSMGGVYTLYMIENHPGLFDYIGILGMGYEAGTDVDKALAPVKQAGYRLLWIGAGKTDIAYDNATRLMDGLRRNQMPYQYFDSQDGHNWRSWRRDIRALLPKLFK